MGKEAVSPLRRGSRFLGGYKDGDTAKIGFFPSMTRSPRFLAWRRHTESSSIKRASALATESSKSVAALGTWILLKRLNPASQVPGIDPDSKALARARRKSEPRGATIQFDEGFAEELPYPDASFDRVLSAFMLHHVRLDAKLLSLQEAFRVLKPGGSLHLVDFDEGERISGGFHGFLASIFHSRHGASSRHTVLGLMQHAGFVDSREVADQSVVWGRIVYYEGLRSPPVSSMSKSHREPDERSLLRPR